METGAEPIDQLGLRELANAVDKREKNRQEISVGEPVGDFQINQLFQLRSVHLRGECGFVLILDPGGNLEVLQRVLISDATGGGKLECALVVNCGPATPLDQLDGGKSHALV